MSHKTPFEKTVDAQSMTTFEVLEYGCGYNPDSLGKEFGIYFKVKQPNNSFGYAMFPITDDQARGLSLMIDMNVNKYSKKEKQ